MRVGLLSIISSQQLQRPMEACRRRNALVRVRMRAAQAEGHKAVCHKGDRARTPCKAHGDGRAWAVPAPTYRQKMYRPAHIRYPFLPLPYKQKSGGGEGAFTAGARPLHCVPRYAALQWAI